MENSKFESFQTLHLLLISMSNGKTVENIAEDKNSRDCFLLFNQKPVKLIQNKNYYPLEGQYVNYIKGKYYFDESTKSIKCERVQIASTFELKPQNDSAVDSAREAQVLSHLKAVTSYEILSPKRIKLLHENGWMEFEVKDDVF